MKERKSENYKDVAFFTYDSPQVKEISQKFRVDAENIFTTTTPKNLDILVTSECWSPDNRIKRKFSFQLSPQDNKNMYENFFNINYELLKKPTQNWVFSLKAFNNYFYEIIKIYKKNGTKVTWVNVSNILNPIVEKTLATAIIDKETIELVDPNDWLHFDDNDEKKIWNNCNSILNFSRKKSKGIEKEKINKDMKMIEKDYRFGLENYQIFLIEAYKTLWKNMLETDEYFIQEI